MALTLPQLQNASPNLSPESISLWITHFKQLPEYKAYAVVYNEKLAEVFLAANGTVKGRQLNALMDRLTKIGSEDVHIRGDAEGTHYSTVENRQTVVREAFGILFDDISSMVSQEGTTYNPEGGNFGQVAVGQRPTFCPRCGNSYGHKHLGNTSFGVCGFCG